MAKRFIIVTDPMSAEQEQNLQKALGSAAWWHWFPNFWLVLDMEDKLTAEQIREKIRKIDISKQCMVFEITLETWSGALDSSEEAKPIGEWIHKYWSVRRPLRGAVVTRIKPRKKEGK